MPQLLYRDFAGQRIAGDLHAPQWTDELLTIEVGFQQNWSPSLAYRLVASGPQGQPGYVQFVMREDMVLFKQTTDGAGQVAMSCVSHRGWALYRERDRIVVEKTGDRKWFFEGSDVGGTEWRLARLEHGWYPAFGIRLEYDGSGQLQAIVYPDETKAVIAFQNDQLARIELPNGYEWVFRPGVTGFLAEAELYSVRLEKAAPEIEGFTIAREHGELKQWVQQSDSPPRQVRELVRRYLYDQDGLGRIVNYVSPCGQEYRFEYLKNSTGTGIEWWIVRRNTATGRFDYVRHLDEGSRWTVERGSGKQDTPLDRAEVYERRVQEKKDFHMVTTSFEYGEALRAVQAPTEEKPVARAAKSSLASGGTTGAAAANVPQPFPTDSHHPDGRPIEIQINGFIASYEYDDRHLPRLIVWGGRRFKPSFDSLGRMRSLAAVGGQETRWHYNDQGLLDEKTLVIPVRGGSRELATRYEYDLQRRLRSVTTHAGAQAVYRYGCEGLSHHQDLAGVQHRYRYDGSTGLLESRKVGDSIERFRYGDFDRLAWRRREAGGSSHVTKYAYDERGRCTGVVGDDPALPPCDRLVARRVRELFQDGSYTEAAFNRRGVLLSLRGNHEADRDFFYSASGELVRTATIEGDAHAQAAGG